MQSRSLLILPFLLGILAEQPPKFDEEPTEPQSSPQPFKAVIGGNGSSFYFIGERLISEVFPDCSPREILETYREEIVVVRALNLMNARKKYAKYLKTSAHSA